MDLSLPLVEFYTLGLAAAWLSLVASVALVVAGAPVVGLGGGGGGTGPDGNSIALMSIWPGSVPNGIGSPSGLKGGVPPSRGSVSPGLGGGVGPVVSPGGGFCSPIGGVSPGSPSCGVWPGSHICEVFLPFFSFLGFFGLGSFFGFGVFTCFAFSGFFPGGGPMDPPSLSSGSGAGRFFDHAPRSSSLSGSSSSIVALSGEIMCLLMTILHPPSSSMGSLSESPSSM